MIAHEIATMLGTDDLTTSLGEPGRVVIFRRRLGIWERDREMEFVPDQCKSLREMREKMADLLTFLQECRIFLLRTGEGPVPCLGDRRNP